MGLIENNKLAGFNRNDFPKTRHPSSDAPAYNTASEDERKQWTYSESINHLLEALQETQAQHNDTENRLQSALNRLDALEGGGSGGGTGQLQLRHGGPAAIPTTAAQVEALTLAAGTSPGTQNISVSVNEGNYIAIAVHTNYRITELNQFGLNTIGEYNETTVGQYRVYALPDTAGQDSVLTIEVVTTTA